MLNLDDPRLIELTEAANRRLTEIYEAFGWPALPRKINPGVVAVVLDLVDTQPAAVKPPEATVNFVPAPKPPPAATQPQTAPAPRETSEPAPDPAPASPTVPVSQRPSNAALLDQAKAFIVTLAVDGIMPTMAEFNKRRPAGMPTANHITQKTYVRWGDLAKQLGLHGSQGRRPQKTQAAGHRQPPAHPAPAHRKPPAREPARTSDHAADLFPAARKQQLEDIIFHLRDLSADGTLPDAATWDQRKPAELPDAKTLLLRWGLLAWDELAGFAKLQPSSKGSTA